MDRAVAIIIIIVNFLLSIAILVGTYFQTQMTFNAKLDNNVATVKDIDQTKLNWMKAFIVILWVYIIVSFLSVVFGLAKDMEGQ
jgi:TRAP-type C4-dicarboxylate transport system permease small subunit